MQRATEDALNDGQTFIRIQALWYYPYHSCDLSSRPISLSEWNQHVEQHLRNHPCGRKEQHGDSTMLLELVGLLLDALYRR